MKFILFVALISVVTADWWESAIFYQIYPRSFKDSNNDGIGDIQGIISKLQYLKDTGITATWLSPILESPQVDYGYDVSDFTKVDPIFGTNEDLEELFSKAENLGIKIIMDFVPNHTSNEHEWFKKSVAREKGYEDFYVWHDGFPSSNGGRPLPPNNWQAVFNTRAWTWNEEREQYYLHQFASAQPDLNYREPRVVEAMKNVLTFWMDKGAHGFRIDAINHMFEDGAMRNEPLTGSDDPNNYGYTHHIYTKDMNETYDMVQEWRELINEYNEKNGGETRVLFTEAYASIEDTIRYYADEEGNPRAHFPFNFVLIEKLNENSNVANFKNEIDRWMGLVPTGATSNWVLGNHDKPRFGSRYGVDRIDGLLTLLLTLPGVAVTYNGDEIGMLDYRDIKWEDTLDPQACNLNDPENYKWASRDPQRTPFQWDDSPYAGFKDEEGDEPWIQVHPDYKTNNLALQQAAPKSFYKFYKQLAELRHDPIFVKGKFNSRAFNINVFGYQRTFEGLSYVILINFSNEEYTVNINDLDVGFPQQSEVVLAGSKSSYETGTIVMTDSTRLRSYDAIILKAKESDEITTNSAPSTTINELSTDVEQTTNANGGETSTISTTSTTDAGSTIVGSFILLISSLFIYNILST